MIFQYGLDWLWPKTATLSWNGWEVCQWIEHWLMALLSRPFPSCDNKLPKDFSKACRSSCNISRPGSPSSKVSKSLAVDRKVFVFQFESSSSRRRFRYYQQEEWKNHRHFPKAVAVHLNIAYGERHVCHSHSILIICSHHVSDYSWALR